MIKYERVGEVEQQVTDLEGVDKVIELARLAKDCPEDLRSVLVSAIAAIVSPRLVMKEKDS